MAQQDNVTLEHREQVAIVTLNRPERANALDQPTWDQLEEVIDTLAHDTAESTASGGQQTRVIIFTGAGSAFCAGHDIQLDNPMTAAFLQAMTDGEGGAIHDLLTRMKTTLSRVEALPVPTIAAINGKAAGGGVELSLCCDLRVMDAEATLCMAETRIGLIPDLGGTVRLVRQVGRSRAIELICTARDVRADEALQLGLVNRISPPSHCLDAAVDLAALIVQNGPTAVRMVKRVANEIADELDAALAAETDAAVECILSGEGIEGVTAWLEGRPAKW